MRWFLESPEMASGWGCQGNQPNHEKVRNFSLTLHPLPLTSGEEERGWRLNWSPVANDFINHASLHSETSIKSQKDRVQDAPSWWTHGGAGRVACSARAWECHTTFPIPCPKHFFLPSGCTSVTSISFVSFWKSTLLPWLGTEPGPLAVTAQSPDCWTARCPVCPCVLLSFITSFTINWFSSVQFSHSVVSDSLGKRKQMFLWVLWSTLANSLNLRRGLWESPIYSP